MHFFIKAAVVPCGHARASPHPPLLFYLMTDPFMQLPCLSTTWTPRCCSDLHHTNARSAKKKSRRLSGGGGSMVGIFKRANPLTVFCHVFCFTLTPLSSHSVDLVNFSSLECKCFALSLPACPLPESFVTVRPVHLCCWKPDCRVLQP